MRSNNPLLYHLLILGLFVILTAVLTYPMVINLTGSIAGSGDAWQALYILWYTKQALLTGNPNITLGFTNYLFYPNGIPMIFTSFSLFDQLLSVPLQMLIGLVPTFNLLWLLSFILAGYGTFLLVRYLTGNDSAAIVSGIILAFCPYHFVQALGHLGATTIEWIPFSALFLIKMYGERSPKNILLASFFFIMVAISDSQYMMFMAFFLALLFLYELAKITREADLFGSLKKMFISNIIFACIVLAVLIPLNYDLIQIAISGNNFLWMNLGQSAMYSQDLLGFIVPGSLHPLYGEWLSQNFYKTITGDMVESTAFAGYTVLALAFVAMAWLYRERDVIFWGICALFFAIMSLGPNLHVLGTVIPTIFPMPYALAYQYVPFINDSRTAGRFDVMVMLSLAVLAGYGLAFLMDRLSGLNIKWPGKSTMGLTIAGVVAILIIFEFLSVPTISQVAIPSIYESIGNESGQFAILEIPASANYSCGTSVEFYNTIDGKQMVGGQVPRVPIDASDFEDYTPLINYLSDPRSTSFLTSDMFVQNISRVGNYILNYYNIRYVILHTDYTYMGSFNYDMTLLNRTLSSGPIYDDNGIVAYQVGNVSPVLFMTLGPGWENPESSNGTTWRWMDKTASINIISPEAGQFNLSFDVSSYIPMAINVTMNNKLLLNENVTYSHEHMVIPVILNKGQNTVFFSSPPGNEANTSLQPAYLISYQSFAFSNVSAEPAL